MNDNEGIPSVRKLVHVAASPGRAFEVFTARMTDWWPPDHSIGKSPMREVLLEPRAGGRWFERDEDGTEWTWGRVLAWEPPARLVLAWQIDANWAFDPDLHTEVEIRFEGSGDETVAILEHRLDGFGPDAEHWRRLLDKPLAWLGKLERFAAFAGRERKQGH